MYHQITELYFKLILHEEKQLVDDKSQNLDFFIEKVRRINSYYTALISSFGIMIKGMEREQFLQYRMALLPASGFQSVQYRMIELYATPLENVVHYSKRNAYSEKNTIEELYEQIYWKKGATDIHTGEKTLTLKQFEYRYTPRLVRIAKQVKQSTIYHKYQALPDDVKNNETLMTSLKTLDLNANVNWPLMHMGSAHRYLGKESGNPSATGGTNWKDFLPPSFQKVIFFPEIYTQQELDDWGKEWVNHIFNPDKIRK
jgi:tryptophan 2,3-dioxygenase